jgi:intracellular sulfur oxidation DsrE/DsrF family protein
MKISKHVLHERPLFLLKGNPNKAMIEAMHKGGVKMYECHVAMKLKGYKPEDIFPFSRVVVSGIGAVVDFEKSGYMEITP